MRYSGGLLAIVLLVAGGTTLAQSDADKRVLYELIDRIDQLEQEVRQMRGAQEVLQYKLDEASGRDQKRYQNTDARLQQIEQKLGLDSSAAVAVVPPAGGAAPAGGLSQPAGAARTTPGASSRPAGGSAQAPAAAPGSSAEEKAVYDRNFALLREGAFDDAIIGFSQQLQRYPSGQYADNAQYWLGEAYYVNRDFAAASEAFQAVVNTFPNSSKLPDARLKLGFTLDEMNRKNEARNMLNSVIQDYPGSSVARLAERRLKQM